MSAAPPPSYNDAVSTDKNGEPQSYQVGYQQPPYPTQPNYAYPPPEQQPYPPQQQPYPPQAGGYAYPPPAGNPTLLTLEQDDGTSPSQNLTGNKKDDEEYLGIVSFDQKSVRLGFIRKVFAILALQMSVTCGMTAWFIFHEPTKEYVQQSLPLYLTSYGLFLVLYIVLACCTSVSRKHPINLILLGLFTLSLSYLVAAISSFHKTEIVLLAFGITLLVSASIIIYASQTKYDFTTWGGILFVCCLSLFFFGIFAVALVPGGYVPILNVVYSFLGALLFMAFLAFDTQLIMGGHKYEIGPEDYVFAALMLYVDIIYILLFLLSLFGGNN